jgi:hypothetical protein
MTEDERTVEVMRLARILHADPDDRFKALLIANKLLCIHGDHSTCNTNLCHVRLFSERR